MCDFLIRTIHPLTLPGVDNRDAVVNDHITTLNGAIGNEWEVRIALLEGNRPVNKVKLGLSAIARDLLNEITIRQDNPTQVQQGKHPKRPRQPPGGAGYM